METGHNLPPNSVTFINFLSVGLRIWNPFPQGLELDASKVLCLEIFGACISLRNMQNKPQMVIYCLCRPPAESK